MPDSSLDPDALADTILPLDGPHDVDNVIAAAGVVAELVRRLNHVTFPGRDTLPDPSQVDRLVFALSVATSRLPQLCRQIARRLDRFGASGQLSVGELGEPLDPATVAFTAAVAVEQAAYRADELADALSRARRSTSRLTYRTGATQ